MSKKIWVTDKNDQLVSITTDADGNGLKQLYCDVFNGDDKNKLPTEYNPKNLNKILNVNIDKLMRRRLYNLHNVLSGKTQPQVSSGPLIDMVHKNIWFRDASGKLYKNDAKGQRIDYGMDDPATINALKADNSCFTTLVRGDDKKMCTKYMHECLLNNDPSGIDECLEFWKKEDFYDVSKNEIYKMHPLVALRTLQKFGFREHEVYDTECGKKIKKVETKDNWTANDMKTHFKDNKTALTAIETNGKLLDYLQLLSEYVNANPKILNKDYDGKTEESEGVVLASEFAQRLGLRMQIVPSNSCKGMIDTRKLEKLVSLFHDPKNIQSENKHQFTGLTYNSPYARDQLNISLPFQLGGNSFESISEYIKKRKNGSITGPEAMNALINKTIDDLKKLGKNVAKSDIDNINNKVKTLQKTELDLIEIEIYLEEYAKQIKLFGDSSINTVSLDQIRKFVEKKAILRNHQKNGETTLVQIFATLQEILQKNNEKNNSSYTSINLSHFS
jgi:hypothetical protein